MNNTFLSFYLPKPCHQVWILVYVTLNGISRNNVNAWARQNDTLNNKECASAVPSGTLNYNVPFVSIARETKHHVYFFHLPCRRSVLSVKAPYRRAFLICCDTLKKESKFRLLTFS